MAAREVLRSLSDALIADERIFDPREKALLATLLRRIHAGVNPNDAITSESLTRIIGEIAGERLSAILGGDLSRHLLKETEPKQQITSNSLVPIRAHSPNPPHPAPAPGPGEPPVPTSPNPPRPIPPPSSGISTSLYPGNAMEERRSTMEDRRSTAAVLDAGEISLAQTVVLHELLAPSELQELIAYTLGQEAAFTLSEVISPGVGGGVVDFEHRRSRVLMDLGTHGQLILDKIRRALPRVLPRLGIAAMPVSRTEIQVTASNDGDFFRWHSDNAHQEIASREVTFVYFFHREPKNFRGGELRIYDSVWENGMHVPSENYRCILPQQNMVVLFSSFLPHEITPVECPSRAFADSRFTVNGWFHR
jgi:hypothetical protein